MKPEQAFAPTEEEIEMAQKLVEEIFKKRGHGVQQDSVKRVAEVVGAAAAGASGVALKDGDGRPVI
ncbi:hypothetical protein [Maridesulfovibrio sp.]|uniref:hypothetical protein n=1 Tax=Maridesulfovibrio sp. TaxID=2795000 RepID=UPI0029CA8890|nr:hypothetical protein [Maridesulfovibrio sp.]